MIKILPLKDKSFLEELNQKSNQSAQLAFCLYEGEECTGYVLYSIVSDCGNIVAVVAEDNDLKDGLIRSALASLYDFGIDRATFFDVELCRKLGILKSDETEIASIKSLLYNCDSCKSKSECSGNCSCN